MRVIYNSLVLQVSEDKEHVMCNWTLKDHALQDV